MVSVKLVSHDTFRFCAAHFSLISVGLCKYPVNRMIVVNWVPSPQGVNFSPGGQMSRLGTKIKTGLWNDMQGN
jgi:hypothetical protein